MHNPPKEVENKVEQEQRIYRQISSLTYKQAKTEGTNWNTQRKDNCKLRDRKLLKVIIREITQMSGMLDKISWEIAIEKKVKITGKMDRRMKTIARK